MWQGGQGFQGDRWLRLTGGRGTKSSILKQQSIAKHRKFRKIVKGTLHFITFVRVYTSTQQSMDLIIWVVLVYCTHRKENLTWKKTRKKYNGREINFHIPAIRWYFPVWKFSYLHSLSIWIFWHIAHFADVMKILKIFLAVTWKDFRNRNRIFEKTNKKLSL